jgi:hypothetical protein
MRALPPVTAGSKGTARNTPSARMCMRRLEPPAKPLYGGFSRGSN